MKITTVGKRVTLKDAFIENAQKKLEKLDKFFSSEAEATVTVRVEKAWQTVEITVRDKGLMVRAEKNADRMEDALADAAELVKQRVIKSRKRMDTLAVQPGGVPMGEAAEPAEDEGEYHVIREKHFPVKPCSPEEAILEMELLGHEFYMFRDADTDEINVVYRRKNGTYGLLTPEK